MALLAEMHYNFIILVYIVSKNITDTTICVYRYSLELNPLSSARSASALFSVTSATIWLQLCCLCATNGSLFLKANHLYYHQIQGQLHITGHSQCDLVVWSTVDYCRSASHSRD